MATRGRVRAICGVLFLTFVTAASADSHDRKQWGPFAGRFVDVDTGQPIPGVAVLVIWRERAGFALLETRFYDAKEAVTDVTGRWEISGLDAARRRVTVLEPTFRYFAAGYVPQWNTVTPQTGRPYIDETVTIMKRLRTQHELLDKSRGHDSDIPPEKMRAYLMAINAERSMLGMTPLPIPSAP